MKTVFTAILVMCTLWSAAQAGETDIAVLGLLAGRFLDSLGPERKERSRIPFDDSRRTDWHYTPRRRPGITLGEMSRAQRDHAWSLMKAALSTVGYDKVRGVILLEEILGEMTGNRRYRDAENYAFLFFGQPAAGGPWGWRFEGHHLSLSFAVAPGEGVSFTPAFYGANPAVVPEGREHAGLRVLHEEHDLALELAAMLTPDQRERMRVSRGTMRDIITGPGREHSLSQPQGLKIGDMSPPQRDKALELIRVYVFNIGEEFAERQYEKITGAGIEDIHIAWGGSFEPGKPFYYRVHGPTTVIEYNAQSDNHVHTVWHDPTNSFGRDMLRDHFALHHIER